MSRYRRHAGWDLTSARERFHRPPHDEGRGGLESIALFVVAVGTLLFIAALALHQLTARPRATRILEQGIAAATEVDLVLQENLPALQRAARSTDVDPLTVPGYPVAVELSRDEVLESDQQQMRQLLISRSAAALYDDGLAALDRTGNQSIGLLSTQRAMDVVVGRLTGSTHDRARLAALVLGAVVAVCSVVTLLRGEGFGAFRGLGMAVFLGALFGLVLTGGAWLIAGRVGGSDAFVADLRTLFRAVLEVPLREYAIVTALGAAVYLLGAVLQWFDHRRAYETVPAGDPEDSQPW
jgi:hypothetical protein